MTLVHGLATTDPVLFRSERTAGIDDYVFGQPQDVFHPGALGRDRHMRCRAIEAENEGLKALKEFVVKLGRDPRTFFGLDEPSP